MNLLQKIALAANAMPDRAILRRHAMSTCSSCNVERSTEPDYSPIQAITGQPFGWYSGDDGEMCPACFTDIFDTANRTRHPKETGRVDS